MSCCARSASLYTPALSGLNEGASRFSRKASLSTLRSSVFERTSPETKKTLTDENPTACLSSETPTERSRTPSDSNETRGDCDASVAHSNETLAECNPTPTEGAATLSPRNPPHSLDETTPTEDNATTTEDYSTLSEHERTPSENDETTSEDNATLSEDETTTPENEVTLSEHDATSSYASESPQASRGEPGKGNYAGRMKRTVVTQPQSIGTLRLTSRGCFHDEETAIEFERRSQDVQARVTVVRKGRPDASNVGGIKVISMPAFRDFTERLRALIDAASVRGRFVSTTRIALSVDLDVDGIPFRCSLDERADVDGMDVAYGGLTPIETLVRGFIEGRLEG